MPAKKPKMSPHNATIKRDANKLKKENFNVMAAIPQFPEPPPIGSQKRKIDLFAQKRNKIIMREYQTPADEAASKEQISSYKRSAAQRRRYGKKVDFEVIEVPEK